MNKIRSVWPVLFWFVLAVVLWLMAAAVMVALKPADEGMRRAIFAGLFIGAVVVYLVGNLRRARQEREEQRIKDEQVAQVRRVEQREEARARRAERLSSAPVSSPPTSPPVSPTVDPAFPISGFEVSAHVMRLFDSQPATCDTGSSGSPTSYDVSPSDSSCAPDTSSASSGSDW